MLGLMEPSPTYEIALNAFNLTPHASTAQQFLYQLIMSMHV